MNRFARLVYINQQRAIVGADSYVILSVAYLNKFRLGIPLQFFRNGMYQWHHLSRVLPRAFQMVPGNEVHGHWDCRRGHPDVHMRSIPAAFIDIYP